MGNVITDTKSLRDLEAYEIISEEKLNDISAYGIVLKHKKSGARIAVISVDDNNKVFSIGFRTTPTDSTGVPHILEHSVLCGSEKFPVKDPFVELCKGSLNTFLNAMTYPDKTIYPVASCNDKDFANLMEVYLDAVLFPNIYKHEEIFLQEGWHYELEDKDAPLMYNGVVYSEMKGAFSNPERTLYTEGYRALLPDTTYGVVSGGDPEEIPNLTYEQFLDFHRRYYHPVNSYIYLYGDMDVRERLEWMDREYLSRFDKIELDSSIAEQKDFDAPKHVKQLYSVNTPEEAENACFYSFGTFMEAGMNEVKATALSILSTMLINTPGAPLKVALTRAGIGADNYGGFGRDTKQPVFSIIAKNASEGKAGEFAKVIKETLENCVKEGLNKNSLRAVLNRMEFSNREADTGRTPKGLIYLIDMFNEWLYDDTRVFDALKWSGIFDTLREKIDTDYFEQVLREEILENKNAVLIELCPQVGLLEKKEKALAEKLAAKKAALSAEEIDKMVAATKALKEYQLSQDRPEDIAKIPRLSKSDIKREARPFINEEKFEKGIRINHQNLATNKIAYLSLCFSVDRLSAELLPYASIMGHLFGDMDTKEHSYLELNNEINIHTGGIGSGVGATAQVDDADQYSAGLGTGARALYSKIPEMISCMKEMLFDTLFEDTVRLEEILKELKSDMEGSYTDMSQSDVLRRLSSYSCKSSLFEETVSGISFYEFISELLADYENQKEDLVQKLNKVRETMFTKDLCMLSITADEEGYAIVMKEMDQILAILPDTSEGEGYVLIPEKKNEGFKTPGQMQYVGCGGNFKKAGYEYSGAFEVLRTAMSYGYLWNNVRVTGGAYGGAFIAQPSGRIGFVSWRDPHLNRTMQVYRDAVDYVANFEASEEELTKYIIGTMSNIDIPMTPRMEGERGLNAANSGNTLEKVQKIRNQILDVTVEDIRALAPIIKAALDQDYCCTIGSAKKVEEDSEHFMIVRDLLR